MNTRIKKIALTIETEEGLEATVKVEPVEACPPAGAVKEALGPMFDTALLMAEESRGANE